jgi:hypothetical protein
MSSTSYSLLKDVIQPIVKYSDRYFHLSFETSDLLPSKTNYCDMNESEALLQPTDDFDPEFLKSQLGKSSVIDL